LGEIGRASSVEGEMEGGAVMRRAGGRRCREERGRTVDGAEGEEKGRCWLGERGRPGSTDVREGWATLVGEERGDEAGSRREEWRCKRIKMQQKHFFPLKSGSGG
jgi:hypothetical protein